MDRLIGRHIKAVLFDHDDTLVATDERREHWGKPLEQLVGLLYDTADIEQAMAYT